MASHTVRAHVLVSGRVQGVFYRATAMQEARARSLTGWVRNNPDGRVEAVFQGSEPAVRSMLAWCGAGPPAARVAELEVSWEAPVPSERGFGLES